MYKMQSASISFSWMRSHALFRLQLPLTIHIHSTLYLKYRLWISQLYALHVELLIRVDRLARNGMECTL